MRLFKTVLMVCSFSFAAMGVMADDALIDTDEEQLIIDKLQQAVPQIPMTGIQKSELTGLYEVTLGNGERVFVSADAKYFVAGDLFQLTDKGLVNLTDTKRDLVRADRIGAIDAADKITFSPETKKASVTVFTDVDCGYCQKLHREMANYLDAGIEVSYLAYPRAGVNSNSYNKIVNAWCADDRQAAMTSLKTGGIIETKTCKNPVADQYQLAVDLGVRGTPAIILESGKLVSGYVNAEKLTKILGL
ncbi:MAG: DsbC family protein [Pseudomonadales bacterium]